MSSDLVCSFTGHRNIAQSHKKNIDSLLLRAIEYAYRRGCRTFLAGGALGFDTAAAKQVILFRLSHPDVRLSILIPCKNQDEHWSETAKISYRYIISIADEVEYVSDEYTSDCMRKRNALLAERADILISYVSHSQSGSAQTVRMAQRLGREIYNLYPRLDSL